MSSVEDFDAVFIRRVQSLPVPIFNHIRRLAYKPQDPKLLAEIRSFVRPEK